MDTEFRNIAERLHTGGLSKTEAALAIHLWQRRNGIAVADIPRAAAIARFRSAAECGLGTQDRTQGGQRRKLA